MTLADIIALGTQTEPQLILASDTGTYFLIEAGADGGDAIPVVCSNIAGMTGATAVRNLVAITTAGYIALGTPDPNTVYHITDGAMSDFGAWVLGQYLADTSATTATPGAGDLRWNNATQTSATELYLDSVTAGGVNLATLLKLLVKRGKLLLQDAADTANFQVWTITATPTVDSENWTIPVALSSSGGDGATGFANNLSMLVATGQATVSDSIKDYVLPQTLTSSGSISMDVALGVKADLDHDDDATITLSNLADGMSGTIRATMVGGTNSVAVAHAGLTVVEMGGLVGSIVALPADSKWAIAYERVGSELWTWTSTKSA